MVEFTVSDDSLTKTSTDYVRLRFNPSGLDKVTKLKMLAAAFITECEYMQADREKEVGRECAVAITNMQTASMWAVSAATKGL